MDSGNSGRASRSMSSVPVDGTRERMLALLRKEPSTVEELSTSVQVTPNAIRAQLAILERDGFIQRVGQRQGARKPSILFGLTEEAERAFSRAYVPVLLELVRVLSDTMDSESLRRVFRRVGEGLAAPHLPASTPSVQREGDVVFRDRVGAAIDLLRTLGASVEVEHGRRSSLIRGHGCPLADVAKENPCVCVAVERLLEIVIGTAVNEQCDRADRPRCRFLVSGP